MSLVPEDRSKLSPMMQQYLSMKDEHRDQILMFRLGDFYEMFFDDAVTASRELELTPRQRQMVELYYDQEMNTTAIAQLLGVQRSTVSRTLRRARARLYQFLRYGL